MVSSGLLRRVAPVRTDVSKEPDVRCEEILRSVRRLLVAACVVPSSPIFVTLMKEASGSSETSVLTRATRRNNPEDTILHSHRRENLISYMVSYIIEDGVLHSHRRESIESCKSVPCPRYHFKPRSRWNIAVGHIVMQLAFRFVSLSVNLRYFPYYFCTF
jgi:hypothetical protein